MDVRGGMWETTGHTTIDSDALAAPLRRICDDQAGAVYLTSRIPHPGCYLFFPGARLSTFPGLAAVNAPFSTTGTPFTITHGMPTG